MTRQRTYVIDEKERNTIQTVLCLQLDLDVGCMAAYGVGTLKLVCGHLDAPAYNFHPPSKGMDKGFVSLWKKLSFAIPQGSQNLGLKART